MLSASIDDSLGRGGGGGEGRGSCERETPPLQMMARKWMFPV